MMLAFCSAGRLAVMERWIRCAENESEPWRALPARSAAAALRGRRQSCIVGSPCRGFLVEEEEDFLGNVVAVSSERPALSPLEGLCRRESEGGAEMTAVTSLWGLKRSVLLLFLGH